MSNSTGANERLLAGADEQSQLEAADRLSRRQVNRCLMELEDTHPLQRRVKCVHIVPILQRCFKPKEEDFAHAVRSALLQKMQIKRPKGDDTLRDDPFLYLGYGVNAYFNTMLNLSKMFGMIFLFVLPLFMVYAGNKQQALRGLPKYSRNRFSLGNLGGSSVFCAQKPIASRKMSVACPRGTYIHYNDAKDAHFGVINQELLQQDFCRESAVKKYADKQGIKTCDQYVDKAFIANQLANCVMKEKLKPNAFLQKNIDHGPQSCDIELWRSDTESLLKGVPVTLQKGCSPKKSNFYLQIPCRVAKADNATRKIFGLLAGAIAAFVYMFTIVYFDYIKAIETNMFVDFDVNTITAGDYTIEFDMPAESHEYFMKQYYDPSSPMSEIAQFKLYVQTVLEERISSMADLGVDEDKYNDKGEKLPKQMKIAQITFAFFNEQVITWLRQRGTYIRMEQWQQLDELNQDIVNGLQDQALLDKLQKPCSCFATFETEEGYARAQLYSKQVAGGILPKYYGWLLEQPLDIQEASEPTDIIWENREVSPSWRTQQSIKVWTIILIMISISAAIIYVCSYTSIGLKLRYPITNCKATTKEYVGNKTAVFTEQDWEAQSFREHLLNEELKKNSRKTMYTEVMQCFCRWKGPKEKAHVYKMKRSDGQVVEKAFCKVYYSDRLVSKILGQMIAFIVIGINYVLKMVIIKLITSIRYDTQSELLSRITNGVFIAQFLNTGFVLLLVNANCTEHPLLSRISSGQFRDYVPLWYSEVGAKLLQTMMINAAMPYITLGSTVAQRWVKRAQDSKDPFQTKETSMAKFKLRHSGADYIIHFKFANVLNVVYVTLMYGVGLPALFPVAAINLLNQYVAERIIVAYYMKLPPSMDNKLMQNCINMLKWGPLLMLLNGYWMLSNRQIFYNFTTPIDRSSEPMPSGHFIAQAFSFIQPSTPVFLMFLFDVGLIAMFIFNGFYSEVFGYDLLQKWGFSMSEKDIMVDENLPNFFAAVPKRYSDVIIKESVHAQEFYGFEFNDPDTVEALINARKKIPKKAIQGTPWYTVTQNQNYKNEFCYIGPNVDKREFLIEDGNRDRMKQDGVNMTDGCRRERLEQSDIVMILLNVAYLPDQVIKQISLGHGWSIRFRSLMDDFKVKWKDEHGVHWNWQTKEVEDAYVSYYKAQMLKDLPLKKRMTEDEINDLIKEDLKKKLLPLSQKKISDTIQ